MRCSLLLIALGDTPKIPFDSQRVQTGSRPPQRNIFAGMMPLRIQMTEIQNCISSGYQKRLTPPYGDDTVSQLSQK